jgi:hypothetical protein
MSKSLSGMKPFALVLFAAALAASPTFCSAADDPSVFPQRSVGADGLYFKVQLSNSVKTPRLKPGDVVDGTLSRDVYSEDRRLFRSGSAVRLTVDHLERRRRTPNDHWPWVVKAFTPRYENYPVFTSATVTQDKDQDKDKDKDKLALRVSLISVSRLRDVHAQAKQNKSGRLAENGAVEVSPSNAKKQATSTLVLEAFGVEQIPSPTGKNEDARAEPDSARPETLPAGTRCKILLLGDVSASKSQPGDTVQARLLEPVLLNSKVVLPAGSVFVGKVLKKTPPRWLSRSGSLYLTFTELTLPSGSQFAIAASLAGVELDARSHTRMDAEGRLRGERPGKAWMAINLGVTAGISKEVDDGVQLLIEALVSTATDASTAGTARILSSCVSGVYMATRHGRDVVLPRFTEMDISLDRPVSLNPGAEIGASATEAGGK